MNTDNDDSVFGTRVDDGTSGRGVNDTTNKAGFSTNSTTSIFVKCFGGNIVFPIVIVDG
jgi:hypothetical protein